MVGYTPKLTMTRIGLNGCICSLEFNKTLVTIFRQEYIDAEKTVRRFLKKTFPADHFIKYKIKITQTDASYDGKNKHESVIKYPIFIFIPKSSCRLPRLQ